MTDRPIDPHAPYDLRLGWPLCVCGHSRSLHQSGGPCRRIECGGVQVGPCCRFYRPSQPIPANSPAMFGDIVGGMVSHFLPMEGRDYDHDEVVFMVRDTVAQLARQWTGWEPEGPRS